MNTKVKFIKLFLLISLIIFPNFLLSENTLIPISLLSSSLQSATVEAECPNIFLKSKSWTNSSVLTQSKKSRLEVLNIQNCFLMVSDVIDKNGVLFVPANSRLTLGLAKNGNSQISQTYIYIDSKGNRVYLSGLIKDNILRLMINRDPPIAKIIYPGAEDE